MQDILLPEKNKRESFAIAEDIRKKIEAVKAGLKNVCVHKGLFPESVAQQYPNLLPFVDVRDVANAAKDWPQLNFIVYHGGYRYAGGGKSSGRTSVCQTSSAIASPAPAASKS